LVTYSCEDAKCHGRDSPANSTLLWQNLTRHGYLQL
jgi:hypothetical protein